MASVMAATSALPAAALAGGPDDEQVGSAPEVTDPTASQAPAGPDVEGPPTDLPFDVDPLPPSAEPPGDSVPTVPTEEGSAPAVEPDVTTGEDGLVVDPGDGTGPEASADAAPPTPESPPVDPAVTPPASNAAPQTPGSASPDPTATSPEATQPGDPGAPQVIQGATQDEASKPARGRRSDTTARRRSNAERSEQPSADVAKPNPSAALNEPPVAASPATSHGTSAGDATGDVAYAARAETKAHLRVRAIRRGARFHIVAPNDSLWSIADRILDADAAVPRIAREVDRLWDLNEARIGTGDPDVLIPGTRLRLR